MRVVMLAFVAMLVSGCGGQQQVDKTQLRGSCSRSFDAPAPVPEICEHDCYHVIIFALQSQGRVSSPNQTHVFATWVRSRDKEVIDQVDISWTPKENYRGEVEGKNKSLSETLEDRGGRPLTYWILRTDKTFFDEALQKREHLALYRAADNGTRPRAVNCIHAVSDVAGSLDTGRSSGAAAGQKVADFFISTGKAWTCNDKWVIQSVTKVNNCKLP